MVDPNGDLAVRARNDLIVNDDETQNPIVALLACLTLRVAARRTPFETYAYLHSFPSLSRYYRKVWGRDGGTIDLTVASPHRASRARRSVEARRAVELCTLHKGASEPVESLHVMLAQD